MNSFFFLTWVSSLFFLGQHYASFPSANHFSTDKRCFELVAFDPNDTFVNLREIPNGLILRSLPNGTRLGKPNEPALIEPGWTAVQVNIREGKTERGYVFSELLHRSIYEVRDPEDTIVNLREKPNGMILKSLVNGTEVAFVSEEDQWTKVRLLSGEEGYIFSTLLNPPSCF